MSDLEQLIRDAIAERTEVTARAVADLHEVTHEASEAIGKVTSDAVHLSLEPLDPITGKGEPYALLFSWNRDDRAIRIFELGREGYPILAFGSLLGWRERSDIRGQIHDRAGLEHVFRDLVSKRDSDVVAMLRFIIGNTAKQPAGAA